MIYDLTVRSSMPQNNGPHIQTIGYLCVCGISWIWRGLPVQTLGVVCPECGYEKELRKN